MTVRFIDANRDELGVEPICRTLQVAPSTYYAAKARPPSARSLKDALMVPVLLVIFQANYSVYGAHKLWKAARRAGYDIGRDQVARLMRQAGIRGVRRGRRVVTTRPDKASGRAPDLVKRQFVANRPSGRPLSAEGLRRVFRYHRERAGVVAGHPHALRHSFGTALAEAGVDLAVMQALMGHDHVDSAAAYIHLSPAHVRRVYDEARARQRANEKAR
jgi:hypothetical protein